MIKSNGRFIKSFDDRQFLEFFCCGMGILPVGLIPLPPTNRAELSRIGLMPESA